MKLSFTQLSFPATKANRYEGNQQKRIINFLNENSLDQETFKERISLLLDPQTCGPWLISCNRKYENTLKENWYKVGEVIKM